jgi:hypothetical protein
LRNASKRIFYNYFLRDMSAASLELVVGALLVAFGGSFGVLRWIESSQTGIPTPLGTIMLAVLPVLLGTQMLLGFVSYDVANVPTVPCSPRLGRKALSARESQRVGPPEEPRQPSAASPGSK